MIPNSTVWDLVVWLVAGLVPALINAWFIGDLILIYWMPRLMRSSSMLSYKIILYLWFVFDVLAAAAAWFIWKDQGKWAGASLIPLIIFAVYFVMLIAYSVVFNLFYKINISFWLQIAITIISTVLTIWFFILSIPAGVIFLAVELWNLYYLYWCFMLKRNNTFRGKVKNDGTGDVFITANSDTIPCKEAYEIAGRRIFFKATSKFGNTPVVVGKNNDASLFVPSSNGYGVGNVGAIDINQPVQFGFNSAQQQSSYRAAASGASNYNINNAPLTMDLQTMRAFQAFQASQMNQNNDVDF